MFDTKRFGVYISLKRKEAGMTQTDFAQQLSVTRQAVSTYETGECFPDISIVIRIAKVFGITIDELVKSGISD